MQTEYEIVIADTSCFILLDKIGELELLKTLFGHVVTTTTIAEEFGSALPEWVQIRTVTDVHFQSLLDIDPGEASAIALAMESEPSLLVIDNGKGRKGRSKIKSEHHREPGHFFKSKAVGPYTPDKTDTRKDTAN